MRLIADGELRYPESTTAIVHVLHMEQNLFIQIYETKVKLTLALYTRRWCQEETALPSLVDSRNNTMPCTYMASRDESVIDMENGLVAPRHCREQQSESVQNNNCTATCKPLMIQLWEKFFRNFPHYKRR